MRPAITAPMMRPRNPRLADTPPANAANIEGRKANEDPRKTGLLNLVSRR